MTAHPLFRHHGSCAGTWERALWKFRFPFLKPSYPDAAGQAVSSPYLFTSCLGYRVSSVMPCSGSLDAADLVCGVVGHGLSVFLRERYCAPHDDACARRFPAGSGPQSGRKSRKTGYCSKTTPSSEGVSAKCGRTICLPTSPIASTRAHAEGAWNANGDGAHRSAGYEPRRRALRSSFIRHARGLGIAGRPRRPVDAAPPAHPAFPPLRGASPPASFPMGVPAPGRGCGRKASLLSRSRLPPSARLVLPLGTLRFKAARRRRKRAGRAAWARCQSRIV